MNSALEKVLWLPTELARTEVAARAVPQHFKPGDTLMVELEPGDDLFILIEGTAAVSVGDGRNQPHVVAELGPGDVCGELSLITRELRSATVTATTQVRALRLGRVAFERILVRHPTIAAHFCNVIARRITETRIRLAQMAHPSPAEMQTVRLQVIGRVSLRRAWREAVANHGIELPLRTLGGFAATLALLRLVVTAFALGETALFDFLRYTYTTGFVLVFAATAASLLRFRRRIQRRVALTLGIGIGAIVNGLSVFLAFDTFYLDMTNRDPAMMFSVEALYRRQESEWAVLIVLGALVQLAFLRRFFRRVWFIGRARLPF